MKPMEDFSICGFSREYSYDIKAFSTYQSIAQSMPILDHYSLFQLMESTLMVYKHSVYEFFTMLTNKRKSYSTLYFTIGRLEDSYQPSPLLRPLTYPQRHPLVLAFHHNPNQHSKWWHVFLLPKVFDVNLPSLI